MLVPCNSLNETHRRTAQCTLGAERKRRLLAAEEEREVTARVFNADVSSRYPSRSITTCYHHRIHNRAPGALSDPSYRSNSDNIAMYSATVFYCRLIYSSIVNNPVSYLAASSKVYLHLLSGVLRGSRPVRLLDTWV